jgi:hypothetical protein
MAAGTRELAPLLGQWRVIHINMAEVRLNFEERKYLLKWYWKFENVVEVQRQWRHEYGTDLPSRLTIARIRDKLELHGTVCDMHKGRSGRSRTATSDEPSVAVLERFHSSPQKSTRQCAHESGVSATSILCIMKKASFNCTFPGWYNSRRPRSQVTIL